MITRHLEQKIKNTQKSVLLFGPRQTGKSTLFRGLKPDLTINLALESDFLRYSSDLDLFAQQITDKKHNLIFVDEIQRIPGLLNTIQATIDEAKGTRDLRFLISGSSARKLKRGHANLLPGRVFTYQLGGIAASEVHYKIDVNHSLKYGFLPEPVCETDTYLCQKLLESYSATYLKEEIQAEALLRNIQGFARFLLTLASLSGQVLDLSKVSTKARVSRTSAARFVEILEDTLIAQRVSIFEDASLADIIRHPKLYFFDGGVLNGLLNNFTVSDDRKGLLFEHLIYSQIRNSMLARDLSPEIYFFRTRSGVEVDFIVKLHHKIWAIEAKTGEVSKTDLNGLKAFRDYYPKVFQCVVVTPSAKRRVKEDILICDWLTLLQEMKI